MRDFGQGDMPTLEQRQRIHEDAQDDASDAEEPTAGTDYDPAGQITLELQGQGRHDDTAK